VMNWCRTFGLGLSEAPGSLFGTHDHSMETANQAHPTPPIHTHTPTHTCTHTLPTHTYTYPQMCTPKYTHTCAYTHTHTRAHTHTHTLTHRGTHTHTQPDPPLLQSLCLSSNQAEC